MAQEVRFGQDYERYFEPSVYLKTYYSDVKLETDDYYTTNLNHWHDVFANNGISPGSRLLDLGCGPNISNVISASKVCPQIVLSEYASVNRDAVVSWLDREPSAHDWTPFLKYAAKKEGLPWCEIESRVRKAIQAVIPCDVHHDNPLMTDTYPEFDVVITSCVLENACQDPATFKDVAIKIAKLVRTGGHFIMVGDLNKSYYMVGKEKFFALRLSQELVESAYKEAGFEILSFQPHQTSGEFSDANGYFFMSARKVVT